MEYILPFGTYEGLSITSKRVSLEYLRHLEEQLLLKDKISTSEEIMVELDREIRRRLKIELEKSKARARKYATKAEYSCYFGD